VCVCVFSGNERIFNTCVRKLRPTVRCSWQTVPACHPVTNSRYL